MADELGTTVGYLIGEAKEAQFLKRPYNVKRFQEIDELTEKDKECVFSLLDAYLAKSKLQAFLK
ncbi:hypothetical protein E5F92_000335 [Flavobacterium columnare]|uniref:hypothetical protein n=1 Tax=Flavobacterium columnare TaxID=996 RepID=UPI002989A56C|nr:hypothetical protein [Flavobacterium columnare]MCH4831205.1 hypothetical protein [Flavobacterium columnare]